MPNAANAKQCYQIHLNRKKRKIGKTIKNNYSATKNFENPMIVEMKSVTI